MPGPGSRTENFLNCSYKSYKKPNADPDPDPQISYEKNKSFVLAMISPEFNKPGNELEIDILGNKHSCIILEESPYDPENKKIRV